MVRREYMVTNPRRIGEMDVLPVLEICIVVGTMHTVHSCVAQARPIGFAILLPEGGYWLALPQDLTTLATAIHTVTQNTDRAS